MNKKIKIQKKVIVYTVLTFILFAFKICLDSIYTYNYDKNISSRYATSKYEYKEYIDTEGDIKRDLLEYLEFKLDLIPDKILSLYFEQQGRILITDKDISQVYYSEYDWGNVVGIHDSIKNIIYISNSKYAIDYALIHEFGHVLDNLTGWSSMEDDFVNIFNKEKETFNVDSVDEHYKENEREFFAEVFQEYIINPEKCKKSAPYAFDFIDKKLKSL